MTRFEAWHLPGLRRADLDIGEHRFGDLDIAAPMLTPSQVQRVMDHAGNAQRTTLSTMPLQRIVAAIDAAAHLVDAAEETRPLLQAVTGYSRETIDDVLAHMLRDWSSTSLNRLLAEELPAIENAGAPRVVFQVFSGNVPGVAVTSIIRALLVRAATLGKTASGEPVLPVLYAHALSRVDTEVGECVAVTYWPGGSTALEEVAVQGADAVVVYGGGETVRSLAQRIPPGTRLIVHGPKLSMGVVGRDAGADIAAEIARATAAYDQQGCVSPHVVYVERDGSVQPRDLAAAIADELQGLSGTLPRRRVSAAEALAIHDARARAEFGAANAEVFASDDTSYTVIYDEDNALVTSCLNRTLYVKPIDDAKQLNALLAPHGPVLQSVALAGFGANRYDEVAAELTRVGVTRVTTFEELPWPPMWWHHDGRPPLQELLFWHETPH